MASLTPILQNYCARALNTPVNAFVLIKPMSAAAEFSPVTTQKIHHPLAYQPGIRKTTRGPQDEQTEQEPVVFVLLKCSSNAHPKPPKLTCGL